MSELLSPKDVLAPFPPVRRTHDSLGLSINEIIHEEIAIESDTLELLADPGGEHVWPPQPRFR